MCVFQSTQRIGTGTQFYQGAGLVNGDVAGVTNDFGTSLNANGQILAGTGKPDTTVSSASGFNDGKPHILTFTRERANGAITLYADGVLAASGTGGTQGLTAPAVLVLGAQPTLVNYFSGDIAEVRLFDVALPPTARQGLETALRAQYVGITSPTLNAAEINRNRITLSWPSIAGLSLYSATNLSPPVAWSPVTNVPATSSGTNSVNLNATSPACFFKLMSQ